jgi:predicted RNA-binding protein YlqC (UPF0109 family)
MSRELLDYLAPWLLDEPDAMEVTEVEGDRGATVYEVKVAAEDAGKIIGRRGRIIRSIRTLARAANRDSGPVMVEVVD